MLPASTDFKAEYFYRCMERHLSEQFQDEGISGCIEYYPGIEKLPEWLHIHATPFWEDSDKIPFQVTNDDGDLMYFQELPIELTFDPKTDVENYMRIVKERFESLKLCNQCGKECSEDFVGTMTGQVCDSCYNARR